MGQSGQNRDNIFYLAYAHRSAPRGPGDQVNGRLDLNLPRGKPRRWTAQRKATIIRAIRRKIINVWDACERYDLSAEEIAEWERNLDRFGVPGLYIRWTNRKHPPPSE
jgi:hypothetical protein